MFRKTYQSSSAFGMLQKALSASFACIISKFSSFPVESSKTQPPEMQQLCLFCKEIILRSLKLEYLPEFLHSTPALPAPRRCGKLLALPAEAGGKPYAMECTAAAFLISRSVIGDLGFIRSRSCRRHLARFRLAFDLEFKAA